MRHIPKMTDMRKTSAEKEANMMPMEYQEPDYPYGLRICLTSDELEKLDMEDGVEVGDYLHLHAFARITSVSENEVNGESNKRIELVLTHIEAEDEESENEENEEYEESYGR